MAEYLTTREVAQYLRLNEKKVYDLVGRGLLPAARVSGKWLFPRHLVDSWVEDNTQHPPGGLIQSLLDKMILLQGSDDPLLYRVLQQFQQETKIPILSARVGSQAGLQAVSDSLAHLACCHLDDEVISDLMKDVGGYCLIQLFNRKQGILFQRDRFSKSPSRADLLQKGSRFSLRQEASGTFRLGERVLTEAGLSLADFEGVGPFFSHGEMAQAIGSGQADIGLGIEWAAASFGLGFLPLLDESFRLALPLGFLSHATIARLLDFLISQLPVMGQEAYPGYDLSRLGKIQKIGS